MRTLVSHFIRDETGATAIEYALIASIIGIGLITALQSLKSNLQNSFNTIGTSLANAN